MKYILKQVSTYTGELHILYKKSRKRAEMYRDIIKPLLKKMQTDNPYPPNETMSFPALSKVRK